jgi:hypothetical protein
MTDEGKSPHSVVRPHPPRSAGHLLPREKDYIVHLDSLLSSH